MQTFIIYADFDFARGMTPSDSEAVTCLAASPLHYCRGDVLEIK